MARLGFVDRDDLLQWGRAQGAPADLPDLVRRLILETTPGVVSLGFAAGGGVYGSGWDGTARATSEGLNVPIGLSLWELSTRGDVNVKADDDYEKRHATPDGTPTSAATYVAVSTRAWQNRGDWARRRRAEGRWANVEALGVDDLDTWLQHAPVTHAWLSERLGFQPHGLVTTYAWWERFAHATSPAVPPRFVLAGRDAVVDALSAELARPGQLITIAGASREEVLAFLAAFIVDAAEKDGGALLSRAAYIDRVEAYRRWREFGRPMVLAALNDEVAAEMTTQTVHHLVVPVVGGHADLDLPPLDAQEAAQTLVAAGMDEGPAGEVGGLARLSLLASRRRIAVKPELHRPVWARPPVQRATRRIVLLGRFSETVDGDVAVVAEAFGGDYVDVANVVTALTVGEDPLLVRLGSTLGVVSQLDAWLQIAPQIRKEDFDAFHVVTLKVLTESDPRLELDPEEQWQAGVLGKVRAYSSDLRQGLATTLALMGAYGDAGIAGARLTAREWSAWIVRQVLEAANADQTARLWASLNDVIPLLAEAAPDEFLAAVRAGLADEAPLLAKLFTDDKSRSSLFTGNSHSGLLWALERVSWSPERLGAVVDLVARWAEVDPGGSYSNRPQATLVDFFRAWYPQTTVGAERRLALLDRLRERHPTIGWLVLVDLLPELHGTAINISSPEFRPRRKRDEPTHADVAGFYEAVTARAIEDADADVARLSLLVDHAPTLPPEGRAALFARLEDVRDSVDDDARTALWQVMRAEVAKNQEFRTAVWALPEDDLLRLGKILDAYRPPEATDRCRFLFDEELPSLPEIDRSDYEEYSAALTQMRAEAAGEIAAASNWSTLYAFARSLKIPWHLGSALAAVSIGDYEIELLRLLDSDDGADLSFASGYFARWFQQDGWPGIERLLAGDVTPRQAARLLLASRDFPAAWGHVGEDAVADVFWREFQPFGLGGDFAYTLDAAAGLYSVARYGAGLDLLHLYLRDERGAEWAEPVAVGLEELLANGDADELRRLSQYELQRLFAYLERVEFDDERLARLEWAYLPAFEFEHPPPTLSRYLAENPSLFVDVVSRVFRPGEDEDDGGGRDAADGAADANGGDDVADEHTSDHGAHVDVDDLGESGEGDVGAIEIARNAYRLLSEWKTLPGRHGDVVDLNVLRAWVTEARAGLREARRLRVGDIYIGKLLATSPPDADGAWPCLAVRELLEGIDSLEIERGMGTEIFNSLGVTSRGALDGGDLERGHAVRYREQADRLADRWPKTAQILREAADTFERMARERDEDAERRRTGFER